MHKPAHVLAFALAFGVATSTDAHHSYAMFDGTRTATIKGTVAKLEWTNPHVFVWMYVPNRGSAERLRPVRVRERLAERARARWLVADHLCGR